MDLNGVEIALSAMFPVPPDPVTIQGALYKPLLLKPFLSKFLSVDGIPDDFQISDLMLNVAVGSPFDWEFELGLSNLWTIDLWDGKTLVFKSLLVRAASETGQKKLLLLASFALAGTELYLSGKYDGQ